MKGDRHYILRWLSGILMLLLLTACSGSSSEGGNEPVPVPSNPVPTPDKPVLKIYIFPPNHPTITRAGDLGNVDASEEENKIHSLHVWVFDRDESNLPSSLSNSKLVGYVSLGNLTLSESGNGEVTMEITDDFANKIITSDTRPKVDVYVAANVSSGNCGISFETLTKKGTTTEGELEPLFIGSGYFGVTSPVQGIPVDGLPMSGVLKEQRIAGTSPVFRVGTEQKLANVQLVRAVSKMRFVFCMSSTNNDDVAVNNIVLNSSVLPKEEYLFLTDDYNKVTPKWRLNGSEYEDQQTLVTIPAGTTIKKNDDPYSYSYDGNMTGQAYENLINDGVAQGKLSDLGTCYLRESDKALSGTINYSITPYGTTTQNEKTSTAYAMKNAGDFSRNHTWIVYGYFVTNGVLQLNVVELKDWEINETDREIYNW